MRRQTSLSGSINKSQRGRVFTGAISAGSDMSHGDMQVCAWGHDIEKYLIHTVNILDVDFLNLGSQHSSF